MEAAEKPEGPAELERFGLPTSGATPSPRGAELGFARPGLPAVNLVEAGSQA